MSETFGLPGTIDAVTEGCTPAVLVRPAPLSESLGSVFTQGQYIQGVVQVWEGVRGWVMGQQRPGTTYLGWSTCRGQEATCDDVGSSAVERS